MYLYLHNKHINIYIYIYIYICMVMLLYCAGALELVHAWQLESTLRLFLFVSYTHTTSVRDIAFNAARADDCQLSFLHAMFPQSYPFCSQIFPISPHLPPSPHLSDRLLHRPCLVELLAQPVRPCSRLEFWRFLFLATYLSCLRIRQIAHGSFESVLLSLVSCCLCFSPRCPTPRVFPLVPPPP